MRSRSLMLEDESRRNRRLWVSELVDADPFPFPVIVYDLSVPLTATIFAAKLLAVAGDVSFFVDSVLLCVLDLFHGASFICPY
jgi:hypothetical protein